jgi:hypothetical protein
MKEGEGSYYTYVDADKYFSGSFRGKEAFRKMFPLIFKVSFKAAGKAFTEFKISSIDISAVNFYEAVPGTVNEQKPEILIRPVSRKGLGMSLVGSFGQTQINSGNITSLSLASDLHSWDVSPLYGYLTSVGVSYFLTDNIALRSGVEFNNYASKFSLSGTFKNNSLATDINGATYYKLIVASYDSLVKANYLTIPLLINYTSGKPGKFGFFAEGGAKISIPVSAKYSVTGDYKTAGFYPGRPTTSQVVDLAELGYYDRKSINTSDKLKLNLLNLAFYASGGINIPLGYYSSISVGPEVIFGLSDIMKSSKKYTDIFGKTYDHQPVKIRTFGFRISLAYKL